MTVAAFDGVAKWYGRVIGLVEVSLELPTGVTGLLGPNGAGKSTFLKLLTGQLAPSQGRVQLLGENPFATTSMHRRVGFLPEPDAFYEHLTGREFVHYLTRLHGFGGAESRRRTDVALERVGLTGVSGRRIRTYSKGMRQRIKLAQAISHEPDVLVLDEPLTGMDPVWRRRTMDLVEEYGAEGRAVIVSSHILHEVEEMTPMVILLHQGRVKAMGDREEIRGVLEEYPHQIRIRSPRARDLARVVLELGGVVGVNLSEEGLLVETRSPDELFDALPRYVLEEGLTVEGLESEDLGLGAIFDYLVS